jgi:hypothetical protein
MCRACGAWARGRGEDKHAGFRWGNLKGPFGRSRGRWEDKTKVSFKDIGLEGIDWIDMAQEREK